VAKKQKFYYSSDIFCSTYYHYHHSEIVADPTHEELEICDGTMCIISDKKDEISELNTISISGRTIVYSVAVTVMTVFFC